MMSLPVWLSGPMFFPGESEYAERKFLTNDDYVFVDDFRVTHGLVT